ncbi:MAG TPA: hypothetical protein VHX66_06100 [Solirubrobacteraceae bacterium]|nr:hypothetical protein [Solirubrobacteraceae bacterium]
MTREPAKSSDQLPEDGPPEVAIDDDASAEEGAAREAAREHARRANRSGHSPGDARAPDRDGR